MIDNRRDLEPLYELNGRKYYYKDIVEALYSLGIKKNDTIFVHSDISAFGKLATSDREYLLSSIVDSFKEVVGDEGIIIMPTFSYSFCNNVAFDVKNSRSTVGTLTEYFRKMADVSRTAHPIFSVAVWGRRKHEYLKVGQDSFDDDSIFGKLHRNNGKIIIFGSPFITSCTFIHYIEQKYKVPYRYFKTFSGKILDDQGEHQDECTYFVRYLDRNVNLDTRRLEQDLIEKDLIRTQFMGNGKIMAINAGDFFNEGYKLLDKDILYFLDGKYADNNCNG